MTSMNSRLKQLTNVKTLKKLSTFKFFKLLSYWSLLTLEFINVIVNIRCWAISFKFFSCPNLKMFENPSVLLQKYKLEHFHASKYLNVLRSNLPFSKLLAEKDTQTTWNTLKTLKTSKARGPERHPHGYEDGAQGWSLVFLSL